MNDYKTSDEGLRVLKFYESCRLKAYWDADGKVWTIGFGDTGPDVVQGLVISMDDALARLQSRLSAEFEPGIRSALRVPVEQRQFDALVSWAYNVGVNDAANSTLMRKLNGDDTQGAADQFPRWNMSGGRIMLGLKRRRASERALFLGANGVDAIRIGQEIDV